MPKKSFFNSLLPFAIQPNQPIGQSFVPSLASVGFIRLWLRDSNPGNSLGATVYLKLWSNSLTNGVLIGQSAPVSMPDSASGTIDFFFSGTVATTPGATYYFQPIVDSGDTWAISAYHFNYTNGTAFFNGNADLNNDMWFREGMIVPEPSGAWLALLGGGVLAWRCRKR